MAYVVLLSEQSKTELAAIKKSGDKKTLNKIANLLLELQEHPRTGTGQVEHLRHFKFEETWSRRINKQYRMMQLVYAFYEEGQKALARGAKIDDLVKLPIREDIGRFKYTVEENVESQFEKVSAELVRAVAGLSGKED